MSFLLRLLSLNGFIKFAFFCLTLSIVYCFGALSGRQRRSFALCRKRPPEKWS